MPTSKEYGVIVRAMAHYIEHCEALQYVAEQTIEARDGEVAALKKQIEDAKPQPTRIMMLETRLQQEQKNLAASATRRDDLARSVQSLLTFGKFPARGRGAQAARLARQIVAGTEAGKAT